MKQFFKNRTVLGIISIVAAIIICFFIAPAINSQINSNVDIVRFKTNCYKNTIITEDMVQVVNVGKSNLPQAVLKDKKDVVGKYAKTDFYKGDYILKEKIANKPSTVDEKLYALDGKRKAISIALSSFSTGLSGKLKAGDIVSVISVGDEEKTKTMQYEELQYLEVVAATAGSGNNANTTDKIETEKELPETITVLADNKQVILLSELDKKASCHIALVYRGEREKALTYLKLQEKINKIK